MFEDKQLKKLNKVARQLARERQIRIDSFLRAALLQPEGREYIYWLLEICHPGQNPFTSNALTTAFSCGELNVGQQIQSHIMEVAPQGYLNMLAEKEEERKNAARSSSDTSRDAESDPESGPDARND